METVDEFVIARNPDGASSLPFLLRVPVGSQTIVLKARDTWPRTSKVYCHPAESWPPDADVIERVPVRECRRRGSAIDLVLARARENRSQFVFAHARGREVVFWQSARTARQARPSVRLPTRRASGEELVIIVDSHERYPWRFGQQQCTTVRRAWRAGRALELVATSTPPQPGPTTARACSPPSTGRTLWRERPESLPIVAASFVETSGDFIP